MSWDLSEGGFSFEADFDRSFSRLEGCLDFYSEAVRGHIRSQQLRFEEAWRHFDNAQELVEDAEENIPNLIRGFLLHIWCFENAIAEAPLIEAHLGPAVRYMPELPQQALEEYPELKLVLNARRSAEALLRLHLGHWDESSELYRDLIEDNRRECEGFLAFYYFGLAACQHNLGMQDEGRRNLENSGFAILSGGRTIHRARAAGILYALYSHLGDEEEATSWVQFLDSLCCPRTTKDVFLERGKVLLDRCTQSSSLLVL